MQRFNTRNYSVRDFEDWHEKGELVLAPKFQRRDVWSPKARSYLMDTIICGKPIPKIYMRQDVHPTTRRTNREIVDGQQRLNTVLTFLKDAFKISKAHNEELGGLYFSGLPTSVQKDILKYEFVVDLLQDMADSEVYDLFARINTYSEKLKPQELRNSQWFGEFKSAAYLLAKESLTFFELNKIFTAKQILRMSEVEFISELLLAMHEGVREGNKRVIDGAYKKYDDAFPNRRKYEKQFAETLDALGSVFGGALASSGFKAVRLFYPLFCAVYHLKFGLPRVRAPRIQLRSGDYPKVRSELERIDALLERLEDPAQADQSGPKLTPDEVGFYKAFSKHWVHADKRLTMVEFLSKQLAKALK